MPRLSHWLHSHTNRRSLLISFLFTFIIIALMQSSLPMTNTALLAESGESILDITFYYTAEEALDRMAAYGPEGRRIYLAFEALDFPFVPAYSLAAAFLLSWLIQKTGSAGKMHSRLNLVPLLVGAADVVENSCVLVLLTMHPDAPQIVAAVASSATLFKHLFIAMTLGALGFCAIAALKPAHES